MWVSCWNCGQEVWLETQKTCRHCDHPVHRCADCTSYAAAESTCVALSISVSQQEAQKPTLLSYSVNCSEYEITPEAMARHGAVAPPPTAPPVVRKPAAPAEQPAASSAEDLITIRREPALRHPKHPLVIAHRGESSAAPENTIIAFKAALAAGAQAIEFDVHLTADGVPVVFHDATVDRCTNGQGPLCEMTLAEVQALDAGSWFAGPFEGERVPTLEEALQVLPSPTVLFIHLRAHENESDRCERAIADAVETHDLRKRAVVTHHTRHGLQRLREMDPRLRLCWIPYGGQPGEEYVDDAYYLGCRFMQPRASEIDEHFMAYAHEKGMWVNAFWADELEEMERLIALKVDGIITNYPRRLREALK